MSEGGVAIVTGASRGIGRAVARALAEAGLAVAVNYREREAEARGLVGEILRAGGRAQALRADVGGRDDAVRLVQATLAAFGRVDVVVNNAGVHLPGVGVADVPADEWERILRVNLSGPFHLIQAVLPHMRARRGGHIVNVSSPTSRRPTRCGTAATWRRWSRPSRCPEGPSARPLGQAFRSSQLAKDDEAFHPLLPRSWPLGVRGGHPVAVRVPVEVEHEEAARHPEEVGAVAVADAEADPRDRFAHGHALHGRGRSGSDSNRIARPAAGIQSGSRPTGVR
jgi:hypothetical protein